MGLTIATVAMVAVPASQHAQQTRAAARGPAAASARQILLIDPLTGRPREATAAELEQLRQLQVQTVVAPPEPIVSEVGGLEGLSLSEDQMLYSVATKRADGTLQYGEVAGRRAANRVISSGAVIPVTVIKKEARDER